MAKETITINRKNARIIANQLAKEFSQIEGFTNQALEDGMYSAAKRVKQKIRISSRSAGKGRWKNYANGWTIKTEHSKKYKIPSYKVWNAKAPGLTHLLENGHRVVTKNGVDTGKRTEPVPHIWPVYEEVDEIFKEEIAKAINGRFGE